VNTTLNLKSSRFLRRVERLNASEDWWCSTELLMRYHTKRYTRRGPLWKKLPFVMWREVNITAVQAARLVPFHLATVPHSRGISVPSQRNRDRTKWRKEVFNTGILQLQSDIASSSSACPRSRFPYLPHDVNSSVRLWTWHYQFWYTSSDFKGPWALCLTNAAKLLYVEQI
jgi:hypothetical protein